VGARVGVGVGEGVGLGEGVGVGDGVGVGLGVGRAVAVASGEKGGKLEASVGGGEPLESATATTLDRALALGETSLALSIEETASRTMMARPVTKAMASQSKRALDRALRPATDPRMTPVRRAPPAQRGFDLAIGSGRIQS
jgi:hypothetical protein